MAKETVSQIPGRMRASIAKAIVGKDEIIDLVLAALFAGGHVLVEDVPGLGKTLLAKALARCVGARFQRIQFTPDLLPSDITGTGIYNERDRAFEFRPGPVFTNILLGDELNRATPRTQSALLEAMEERQVSVDGVTHPLPPPFFVIATQNPVEQQGVYILPEAQLDRFLMQVAIGYPTPAEEVRIVRGQLTRQPLDLVEPVATADEVVTAQRLVREIHVDTTVAEYAVSLVTATRRHKDLVLGASPRASLSLLVAAQALSFVRGVRFVAPDQVKELAPHVLRHRLIVRPQSLLGGRTPDLIISELLDEVPVPITAGKV